MGQYKINQWIEYAQVQDSCRPQFWSSFTLAELNPTEWEALCDGCGLCCLVKLEDEDTGEVAYTKVACKLLDCQTARCSDYVNRKQHVPDCLSLTPDIVGQLSWLPKTCAYRCVYEGRSLPQWHPLLTNDPRTVINAKKSVAGRCMSETEIHADDIEDYIVRWVR